MDVQIFPLFGESFNQLPTVKETAEISINDLAVC